MSKAIRRAVIRRHFEAAAVVNRGVLYPTISAGMILARRYRAIRGAEPRLAWSKINGVWRRVLGYLPEDLPVLDAALAAYPRTADLAPGVTA